MRKVFEFYSDYRFFHLVELRHVQADLETKFYFLASKRYRPRSKSQEQENGLLTCGCFLCIYFFGKGCV